MSSIPSIHPSISAANQTSSNKNNSSFFTSLCLKIQRVFIKIIGLEKVVVENNNLKAAYNAQRRAVQSQTRELNKLFNEALDITISKPSDVTPDLIKSAVGRQALEAIKKFYRIDFDLKESDLDNVLNTLFQAHEKDHLTIKKNLEMDVMQKINSQLTKTLRLQETSPELALDQFIENTFLTIANKFAKLEEKIDQWEKKLAILEQENTLLKEQVNHLQQQVEMLSNQEALTDCIAKQIEKDTIRIIVQHLAPTIELEIDDADSLVTVLDKMAMSIQKRDQEIAERLAQDKTFIQKIKEACMEEIHQTSNEKQERIALESSK